MRKTGKFLSGVVAAGTALALAAGVSGALLSLNPWAVAAQGPPPRGGGFEMRIYEQLDMTDAQKTQIRSLREQERTASEPYREQQRQAAEAIRAAVQSDGFDETAVRKLAVLESEATVELRVISARTEAAIYSLLTSDQKAKLGQLRRQFRRPPME